MGVEYSAAAGYGFVLGPSTDWQKLRTILDLDEEDWDSEIVEAICRKYGLKYVSAGDSYDGTIYHLVGEVFEVSEYRFREIPEIKDIVDLRYKIFDALRDLELDIPVGHYAGMHVY